MSDFNIRFDLSPYYPDIFLKDKIYQTMDSVDYTTYISANSTIFIFNINCSDEDLKNYNDPGYLLFGIENSSFDYKIPSTYFFSYTKTGETLSILPYKIVEKFNFPTNQIQELLKSIGYNVNKINTGNSSLDEPLFTYYKLEIDDKSSNTIRTVFYLFFTEKDLDSINYNNYNSTTFYNSIYNNVFIYPYININNKIQGLEKILGASFNFNNFDSSSTNYIDPVDFDDKELIKYYEKIDYKYMERANIYTNTNNKLELLKYLSKNYNNFESFFNKCKEDKSIVIQNNEISKTYFSNMDYENKTLKSLTLTRLNNKHVNMNLTFSGKDKKYSFSLDNKIAYVKKNIDFNKFRYCPYNCSILNTPSIYQMNKNYYINGYINITKIKDNQETILYLINSYIYKTLVLINPNVINLIYLISQNVKLSIYNLFTTNNNLNFGTGINKINLYFVGTVRDTNTYYINKYKIVFSFNISNEKPVEYIIILGICFYNGDKINIKNTRITKMTNDLGYILYTNEDCSVGLAPQLYNQNNTVQIYETRRNLNLYDVKNILANINYDNIDDKNLFYKNILFNNYYTFIPYINPSIIQFTSGSEAVVANNLNVNVNKLNNFIKNMINISTNIIDLVNEDALLNLYNNLTYDLNLEKDNYGRKYIENFVYFPKILLPSNLPNTIYKYRLYTEIPNTEFSLEVVPAGYYKILKYTNYYPEYVFDSVSSENDKIILTIDDISKFLKINFCFMIKMPNDVFVDDSFMVDIFDQSKSYYMNESNYSFNIGSSETQIYLVALKSDDQPYINTQNIMYGFKLFNFFNSSSGLNELGNKYIINLRLYISSYLNFYQMIFNSNIFIEYNENNNCINNVDENYLELHNKNLLKDIVYYDFIRFNYDTDLTEIKNEYNNYKSQITDNLYNSKYYENLVKININRLVYISNTNKLVISLKKILNYLKLISNYIILENDNYEYIIEFINYNASVCYEITQVNYNIGTTYSTNNYYIQNLLTILKKITKIVSLQNINNLINSVTFCIEYFKDKILLTIKQILINSENVSSNADLSQEVKVIFGLIEKYVFEFSLNKLLLLDVENSINNLKNNDIVLIIKNRYPQISDDKVVILLDSIICLINIYNLNTKKIDELMYLLRLTNTETEEYLNILLEENLNDNVVKNFILFNTDYYVNQLDINNFNLNKFLTDYKTCIIYFSNPDFSSPVISVFYKKAISEGIVSFIDNTINYYSLISKQIIGIYKFIYNINIGVIPKVNIYEPKNISKIYYLLGELKKNYEKILEIADRNSINIFVELNPLILFFTNFIKSVKEFLFYIEIKLYLSNISQYNQIIFLDILKILEITELFTIINKIIDVINNFNSGNQKLINDYLSTIYQKIELSFGNGDCVDNQSLDMKINEYNKTANLIKKNNTQISNSFYENIIKCYIIKYKLKNLNGTINILDFQGQEIIIYQDFNLLYSRFIFSSFNFNKEIIKIIKLSNNYKLNILDYYYQTPNIDFYKQLINYNYLNNNYVFNSLQQFNSSDFIV